MALPAWLPGLNVLSIVAFLAVLAFLLWRDRENIERYGIVFVRRTQHGIDYIDRVASVSPRIWRAWATVGIPIGFGLMAFIVLFMLRQTLKLFLVGNAAPPVGPLVPTVNTVTDPAQAGYLGIPFWHFMISLSVILVTHEMMHGVLARVEGFDIDYVGLILFAIIPGAFVQPEGQKDFFEAEPGAERGSPWEHGTPLSRLRVLVAGPWANISVAILLGLLYVSVSTAPNAFWEPRGAFHHQGIDVMNVSDGSPAARAGLEPGMRLVALNGTETPHREAFFGVAETLHAGDTVNVTTAGNGTYTVTLGERPGTENTTFTPAPVDYILPLLERYNPGTIMTYEQWNDILAGNDDTTLRIARWNWIRDNYEGMEATASRQITALEQETGPRPGPGYFGIMVAPAFEPTEAFKPLLPFHGALAFVFQVIGFIVLLSLAIGTANLLPIARFLDGGWMLTIALEEYIPARAEVWGRVVSRATVWMIVISFGFLFLRYLV